MLASSTLRTAGLPRWRSHAGRLFAARRPRLRRCYQHCLKNTATRVVTSPAVRRFCLCCCLDDTKAGVLSNNASVYCQRTGASVACHNVSCSLVWTGVMPLCGLCSISTATSELIRPSLLLAEMLDITGIKSCTCTSLMCIFPVILEVINTIF